MRFQHNKIQLLGEHVVYVLLQTFTVWINMFDSAAGWQKVFNMSYMTMLQYYKSYVQLVEPCVKTQPSPNWEEEFLGRQFFMLFGCFQLYVIFFFIICDSPFHWIRDGEMLRARRSINAWTKGPKQWLILKNKTQTLD